MNVTVAVSVNDYNPIGADCAADGAADCMLYFFHGEFSGLVRAEMPPGLVYSASVNI
jgi:hypothetical protein